jgi:ribosomal protein L20
MSDCCHLLKKHYEYKIIDLKNEYDEYRSLYCVIMNSPLIRGELLLKNDQIENLKKEVIKLQQKIILLKFENLVIKLLNK